MAFLHEICTKDYCPTSVPLNAVTYAIISHQTVCKLILKLQANRNMANIVLELDPNPAKKNAVCSVVNWMKSEDRQPALLLCFLCFSRMYNVDFLFLFRAVSNGPKERSCQICLTFDWYLIKYSLFRKSTECKWLRDLHITDNRELLVGWSNTVLQLVNS